MLKELRMLSCISSEVLVPILTLVHDKVKFEALKKWLPSVCKVALDMTPVALLAICSKTGDGPAVVSHLWFLCHVGWFTAVGINNAGNCQLQIYVSWVKTWKEDFIWKQDYLLFLIRVSGNSWLRDPFKMFDNWMGKPAKFLCKQCLPRPPLKCTVNNHEYKQSRLTELLGMPTYSPDPMWPLRVNQEKEDNIPHTLKHTLLELLL